MGIPSAMRDAWNDQRRTNYPLIASPDEEERFRDARDCTQEGFRAGAKAAAIACVVSAVPTVCFFCQSFLTLLYISVWPDSEFTYALIANGLVVCRTVPWAKANLNYTAQALIISAASMASYFITADKTILERARRNAGNERRA